MKVLKVKQIGKTPRTTERERGKRGRRMTGKGEGMGKEGKDQDGLKGKGERKGGEG